MQNTEKKTVVFIPFLDENPYQKLLGESLQAHGIQVKGGFSLGNLSIKKVGEPGAETAIHLHWLPTFPETLLGSLKLTIYLLRLWLQRILGKKIVWTVHNLYSHECAFPNSEKKLGRGIFRIATSVIVHSESAANTVREEFAKANDADKICIIPHGNYIGVYPNSITPSVARKQLSLPEDADVFLFLGYIRPYKGVNDLVDAFVSIRNENARLVIAGRPYDDTTIAMLKARSNNDPRIIFCPGFIDDKDMQLYFNAANVVVFPYREVLTSGAIILGMSFGKACVAPRLGCIPDYLDEQGAFLYDFKPADVSTLADALQRAINDKNAWQRMGIHNHEKATHWDWMSVAKATSKLYS